MLSGTANIETLAQHAPTMASFAAAPLQLERVHVLQVMYEIDSAQRQVLLPPGLHPTDPPLINWLVYHCAVSPWGPFVLAQTRIECRSGLRLRAFLVQAVVDNAAAADALQRDWGFTIRVGEVSLRRYYDTTRVQVALGGELALDLAVGDPDPLDAGDIQYVANMHLAHTPRGVRLVQVEPRYRITRAERATPHVATFAGACWGLPAVRPLYPVSASITAAEITVPSIRFVCRPDVWAFEGTELVG
jgi:hypothetical protein